MWIRNIELRQFRNLDPTTLDLHPVLNVIYGRNAQGKTNLLEAIYVLASLKSFRHGRNVDLIRWEQEDATIQAIVERRDIVRRMRVHIRPGRKVVHVDGKIARSLQDSFGHVHVVLFSPEDLAISKGSPSNRRTFLDRAIFNMIPAYYSEYRTYDKALKSRNAVLRDDMNRGVDRSLLAVFDHELVVSGARVIRRRLQFLDLFKHKTQAVHRELCSGQHTLELAYESSVAIEDGNVADEDIVSAFQEELQKALPRDLRRRSTSCGPHSDDIAITLDGRAARIHASQGQHRSIVLAMKIAEITLVQEELEVRPILLLDDVSSELDRLRNSQLIEYLEQSQGQVIVTTTDPDYIPARGDALHLEIEGGVLQSRGS